MSEMPSETETPVPLTETPPPALRPTSPGLDKPERERQSQREAKIYKVKTDCIGCGQKLAVRAELLRKKLKCPSCGMRMHIGRDGKWYEGHTPKPAEVDPAEEYLAAKPPDRPAFWRRTRAGKFLLQYWKQVRLVMIGSVLIVAVGFGISQVSEQDLPESLDQRTDLVAQAVVKKDGRLLGRLTDTKSSGGLQDWAAEKRKKVDLGSAKWKSEVLFTDYKKGTATTIARMTSDGHANQELILQWKLGSDKIWRLDGDRTTKSR